MNKVFAFLFCTLFSTASMLAQNTGDEMHFFKSLETLPDTVHFDAFNEKPYYRKKIANARADLMAEIEKLGGIKTTIPLNDLGTEVLPLWDLDITPMDGQKVLFLGDGKFQMRVDELKKLNQTAYATYIADSGIILDGAYETLNLERLRTMLKSGSRTHAEYSLAMYRCVASDVVSMRSSRGTPYQRTINEPLCTYRIYTTNAPNLAYDALFTKLFVNERSQKLKPSYKETLKKIFYHVLSNMKQDGIEVPVLPGFGLGSFLPYELKDQGIAYFAEALTETLNEGAFTFKGFIFADPSKHLHPIIKHELKKYKEKPWATNFHITNKSCLDVAHFGATLGIKTGLLNAGDPSCVAGQFWQKGHIALEEMCGLFTTMVLSQTYTMNPHLQNNISKFNK